jgi:hypothetical protein
MKKSTVLALVASTLLLGGCQNMLKTMVAHIRIDNEEAAFIARANAYTNFCLSKNMVNKQTAYDFSTTAAELLDLVVFDNDFYKATYERAVSDVAERDRRNSAEAGPECEKLDKNLPTVTAKLRSNYRGYAKELGVARSEENQRLAQQMSSFKLPNTPTPQISPPMSFPNIGYAQQQPQAQNFLINSKSGLTQCRVTKNNFVFCL